MLAEMNIRKTMVLMVGAMALLAVPFLSDSNYYLNIIINAFFFTVLAMSLNVIYGYTGLLSFAQVAFWGIGGYVGALTVMRLGGSVWEGMLLAALLCMGLATVIGAISLRLSNHAFVIVSIAFTLLMQLLASEWIEVTNGPMGIAGLPSPAIALGSFSFEINSPFRFYFLAAAFAFLSLATMRVVLSSRLGRTLKMIKHDETLARSCGVRVTRWKLFSAAFSAAFAALAGSLYVFSVSVVDPIIFDVYFTQLILVIVIVGGLGSYWPVVIAGFVLTVLPELLRTPNEIRMINYGVILILTIILFPRGLAGLAEGRLSAFAGRLLSGRTEAHAKRTSDQGRPA